MKQKGRWPSSSHIITISSHTWFICDFKQAQVNKYTLFLPIWKEKMPLAWDKAFCALEQYSLYSINEDKDIITSS